MVGTYLKSLLVAMIVFAVSMVVLRWHENLPLLNPAKHASLPLMIANDSKWYLDMAQNGLLQIPSPFSKRVFYPYLASWLSTAIQRPLPEMFLVLNITALSILAFCLAEYLRITIGKPFLTLLFLLTPLPLESLELAYLPDLFHMAITSIFFLLLLQEKNRLALLVLFIGFLTRENTLLLCLFTAFLGWMRNDKLLFRGAFGVLFAGTLTTGFFVKMGQPNPHHLPDFLYLLGKIPYYFMFNLLGMRIWSNVRPDEGVPFLTWHRPDWLNIGADDVVGLCSPDWKFPIFSLLIWLTVYGIGPLLLFYAVRQIRKLEALPFSVHLALAYGLFSFAIGPLLGDWVVRLVGYSWPAFWIALPVLFFNGRLQLKTSSGVLLCIAYWVTAWGLNLCHYFSRNANPWPAIPVLIIYAVVLIWMRNETEPDEVDLSKVKDLP